MPPDDAQIDKSFRGRLSKFAENHIAKAKWFVITFGVLGAVFFIVFLIDLVGLFSQGGSLKILPLNDSWRDSLFALFGFIFALVSLFISIIIFYYQEGSNEKQKIILGKLETSADNQEDILGQLGTSATNQETILGQLGKLMNDYSPFGLVSKNASEQFSDWQKDPKGSTYIFYFPYTIIPGFWNDAGENFEDDILKRLEKLDPLSKNKFIFIGSALENSPFSQILDEMEQCCSTADKKTLADGFAENRSLWTNLTLENCKGDLSSDHTETIDFQPIKDKFIEVYNNKLDRLEILSRSRNYVTTILIGQDKAVNDWTHLPSCSFILKQSDDMENGLIYIDTFDFLTTNMKSILDCSRIDSIIRKKNPYILLETPRQYFTQSRKIISLFTSTVLECCFYDQNDIKSSLES